MTSASPSPPAIAVIGMGEDGLEGLAPPAAKRLLAADIIVASRRLAQTLPDEPRSRARAWPSPFHVMANEIANWRKAGKSVVVLATGDPFWFGAGSVLARHFAPEELDVFPAPSAFSLAAARMGWPLQEVQTLSLHGRPAALIEPLVQPGARLLVLTHGARTLAEVARRLVRRGFGESRVTILAHMGGNLEQRLNLTVQQIAKTKEIGIPDFHTLAIECIAGPDALILPRAPGLPDCAFVHDGQITKQAVRAVTVSALAPRADAVLWDIGAGCGSVAVEWQRIAGPAARAFAVECKETRCAMIAQNADRLGAPGVEIIAGEAPDALADLPPPDAIFIGGATADTNVFDACWRALRPLGVLVANAVTLAGEAALIRHHERLGGELLRLSVARATALGQARALRPALTVTQLSLRKEKNP